MSDTYNIYFDESRIDNPTDKQMVIGGICVDRKKVEEIRREIGKLRQKYKFFKEIKWSKVDSRQGEFLKELSTYLLKLPSGDLSFNCIVVNKEKIKYDIYHKNDKELAFFKFTYILLSKRIKNDVTYYIFLDYKPTKIKERVLNLKDFLDKFIYFNKNNCKIKHLQAYSSKENVFIQIADLFCGAVGYQYNEYPIGTSKNEVANFIAELVGEKSLRFISTPSEAKFNIWEIRLE